MQEENGLKTNELTLQNSEQNTLKEQTQTADESDRNEMKAGPSLAGVALQKAGFKKNDALRGKAYLPDDIKARLEQFNQDLEDGTIRPDGTSSAEDNEGEIKSYYAKARRLSESYSRGNSAISGRMRRNFKVFVLIVICFAAYYVYAAYYRDMSLMAVSSLQEQLPLKLDPHTVLSAAELTDREFILTVKKDNEAFKGEDEVQIQQEFDRMALSVKHLCANDSINKIISSGRELKVEVSAFEGRYKRTLSVSSCESK